MKWISVYDELPEENTGVLMLFEHGYMAGGYCYDDSEGNTWWCAYTDDKCYEGCDSKPTHWMPLPNPPREFPPRTQCWQCGRFISMNPKQTVIKLEEGRFLCPKCSAKRKRDLKALGQR